MTRRDNGTDLAANAELCPRCGALPCDQTMAPVREAAEIGRVDLETRFWSIVNRDGLNGLPCDMWAALETLVNRAALLTDYQQVLAEVFADHDAVKRLSWTDKAGDVLCGVRLSAPTPNPQRAKDAGGQG